MDDNRLEQEIDQELAERNRDHEYHVNQLTGGILFYIAVIAIMIGMMLWLGVGAGLVMNALILFGLSAIHLGKKR